MAKLHKHMIVHATVDRPPLKADEPMIENWLTDIVHKMDMEVLRPASAAYCEQVGNRGMTADILITTSHIMLHTWDECDQPFIEFDVYTCSELDPQMVIDSIQMFEPKEVSYKFLDRYEGLTVLGAENVAVAPPALPALKKGRTLGDAIVEVVNDYDWFFVIGGLMILLSLM